MIGNSNVDFFDSLLPSVDESYKGRISILIQGKNLYKFSGNMERDSQKIVGFISVNI